MPTCQRNQNSCSSSCIRSKKQLIFKTWPPIVNCISQTNNAQVYNSKDLNIVVPTCNLLDSGLENWDTWHRLPGLVWAKQHWRWRGHYQQTLTRIENKHAQKYSKLKTRNKNKKRKQNLIWKTLGWQNWC